MEGLKGRDLKEAHYKRKDEETEEKILGGVVEALAPGEGFEPSRPVRATG